MTSRRQCTNDGCARPHHARGLCHRCYNATRGPDARRPHALTDREAEEICAAVESLIAAVRSAAARPGQRTRPPAERIGPSAVYQELERLLAGDAAHTTPEKAS